MILRAPQGADLAGWSRLAASERSRYMGGPYSDEAAFRAWCHVIGQWLIRGYGPFVMVLRDSGAAIGHCGPWYPQNWPEPELGWSIWDEAQEGKGLAAEAVRAVRDHAFGVLGWPTAISYVYKDNLRSAALAERLGAVREADGPLPVTDQDWSGTIVFRHTPERAA